MEQESNILGSDVTLTFNNLQVECHLRADANNLEHDFIGDQSSSQIPIFYFIRSDFSHDVDCPEAATGNVKFFFTDKLVQLVGNEWELSEHHPKRAQALAHTDNHKYAKALARIIVTTLAPKARQAKQAEWIDYCLVQISSSPRSRRQSPSAAIGPDDADTSASLEPVDAMDVDNPIPSRSGGADGVGALDQDADEPSSAGAASPSDDQEAKGPTLSTSRRKRAPSRREVRRHDVDDPKSFAVEALTSERLASLKTVLDKRLDTIEFVEITRRHAAYKVGGKWDDGGKGRTLRRERDRYKKMPTWKAYTRELEAILGFDGVDDSMGAEVSMLVNGTS